MNRFASIETYKRTGFGRWGKDTEGLPCFIADLENNPAPYYSFPHLMSTGHASLLTNQWGNTNLLTTEGGTTSLTPTAGNARSGMYPVLQVDGETISLLYSELNAEKELCYGIGYAIFSGEVRKKGIHLFVEQQYLTPPDRKKGFIGWFKIKNLGLNAIHARIDIRSDIYPRPLMTSNDLKEKLKFEKGEGFSAFRAVDEIIGDIQLAGSAGWASSHVENSLLLSKNVTLDKDKEICSGFYLGYGKIEGVETSGSYIEACKPDKVRRMWKDRLSSINFETPEEWMKEECVWTLGQLLSFSNYDKSVDEYFVSLGGYGFFSDPDDPSWSGFGVREACETALVLSCFEPALAKSSLKWVAKTQLLSGDIPKSHDHRKERNFAGMHIESDNEIWFVLGVCEYVKTTGDLSLLDELTAYWDKGSESLWEHVKKAFYWVKSGIGLGAHGLILMKQGDWNDYLSRVGQLGRGESVMNSGMACRAFALLSQLALEKGENGFSKEVDEWTNALKSSVEAAFDTEWFVRAYTDDGDPVGSFNEDRVFINAQSWAALGGCGTKEQRRLALMSAVSKCHTDIGLTLMSRPYSSPAPSNISWAPIPAGEGENAGIWPQTAYWMVWALAEEGLLETALEEWECMSLRNHSKLYPEVPFGIYNGPDCYSSKYAGKAEGWTQVQSFNRMVGTPMNPIVAWQAFAMKQISDRM